MTGQQWAWAVAGCAVVISVGTELRTRRVLNTVTLPAMLLVLSLKTAMNGLGGPLGPGFVGALAGAVGVLVVMLSIPRWVPLGGGSVKLLAVVGAAIGPIGAGASLVVLVELLLGIAAIAQLRGGIGRKVPGSPLVAVSGLVGAVVGAVAAAVPL